VSGSVEEPGWALGFQSNERVSSDYGAQCLSFVAVSPSAEFRDGRRQSSLCEKFHREANGEDAGLQARPLPFASSSAGNETSPVGRFIEQLEQREQVVRDEFDQIRVMTIQVRLDRESLTVKIRYLHQTEAFIEKPTLNLGERFRQYSKSRTSSSGRGTS
jgi:hypothetical protein